MSEDKPKDPYNIQVERLASLSSLTAEYHASIAHASDYRYPFTRSGDSKTPPRLSEAVKRLMLLHGLPNHFRAAPPPLPSANDDDPQATESCATDEALEATHARVELLSNLTSQLACSLKWYGGVTDATGHPIPVCRTPPTRVIYALAAGQTDTM